MGASASSRETQETGDSLTHMVRSAPLRRMRSLPAVLACGCSEEKTGQGIEMKLGDRRKCGEAALRRRPLLLARGRNPAGMLLTNGGQSASGDPCITEYRGKSLGREGTEANTAPPKLARLCASVDAAAVNLLAAGFRDWPRLCP